MANTSTANKEYAGLKNSVAQLVGGNSDGKKLYLEVEVFDGEHTNRFEPEFPANTSAEEVTEYLKSLIEDNPKVPDEIVGLMQKKIFWDAKEDGWYSQFANEKPVRMDEDKNKSSHSNTHTAHKK